MKETLLEKELKRFNSIIGYKYYLKEEETTNKAPQGVIFLSTDKVLVGDNHHDRVELSEDLLTKVFNIGKEYGYFGEGSGIQDNKGVISSEIYDKLVSSGATYKNSWDSNVKIPNDEKYVYIATVFSNTKENERVPKLLSKAKKDETIFSLLSREVNNHTESGLNLGANEVKRFLGEMSENGIDFIKLSGKPATEENLTDFIGKGEELMWPSNWEDYPNKAGKLARRETMIRDNWIINEAPPGLYFIGSGHLKDIAKMTGKSIIDGSSIGTGSSISK
jgi:hypothetical protein